MASETADETADEAHDAGRKADQYESAERGAGGIQSDGRDGQHEEVGQRMNRPDGPHDEPGDSAERAAEEPADESGDTLGRTVKGSPGATGEGALESAGADERGGADATDGAAKPPGTGPEQGEESMEVSGGGLGGDIAYAKEDGDDAGPPSADVGEGAGAVISAGLGVVSLTGSWLGTVAGARESLIGQLQTSQGASVATKIREVYGDQWHAIALVGGVFALLALLIGVIVLARPAFGPPRRPQPSWIKAVSWGGVLLGVVGLLLAVLKYTDAILGLPSVQS